MKKIIGGLLACACVWLASPVLAATITVNDVVDVGSDYARYFLNQSNHIVGFTTPTTNVEAWDVVEGTVRFTGGHIKATDLSSFTVYGKVYPYGVMTDVLSKEVALLDANGNEFGTKNYSHGTIMDWMAIIMKRRCLALRIPKRWSHSMSTASAIG